MLLKPCKATKMLSNKKIAIVYDRVNKFGGAERVLLALNEIYPNATLYTSVYDPQKATWAKVFPKIKTSFLNKIHFLRDKHILLGWLMPFVFEQFDFSKYDIVISVTSEAAKGIITTPKTFHYSYILTPTRYLWSGYDFYLNHPPKIFKLIPGYKYIAKHFLLYVSIWDRIAASRPDFIATISTEVKKRVKKYYNRESEIIYPPVDLKQKKKVTINLPKDYFLIHGRFEPYKRLDLAIKLFSNLKRNLVVSGMGSEFEYFRKINRSNNIIFINKPSDDLVCFLYKNAKALIQPQLEDFGIVSLEAQLHGTPVITYSKGGSNDTVVDGKTGVYFKHQNTKSLKNAIAKFDKISFNQRYLIKHAKKFNKARFKRQLQRSLIRAYLSWRWGNETLA